MSILIKGMEMPSCCMFCPVSNNVGCGLTNPPVIITTKEMLAGRADFCPLVSVPPHGRLIDADALIRQMEQKVKETNNARYAWVDEMDISFADTIIEAEEDET